MIYSKKAREIGNFARADAISFTIVHEATGMKGSQVVAVSICPWRGFHIGKKVLLFARRSNAQETGFYLRLLLVPRSYVGPFSILAIRNVSGFYEFLMRMGCVSMRWQPRKQHIIFSLVRYMHRDERHRDISSTDGGRARRVPSSSSKIPLKDCEPNSIDLWSTEM